MAEPFNGTLPCPSCREASGVRWDGETTSWLVAAAGHGLASTLPCHRVQGEEAQSGAGSKWQEVATHRKPSKTSWQVSDVQPTKWLSWPMSKIGPTLKDLGFPIRRNMAFYIFKFRQTLGTLATPLWIVQLLRERCRTRFETVGLENGGLIFGKLPELCWGTAVTLRMFAFATIPHKHKCP